jgi:catechol 2,3-dioxygenase-like lactoylglutathione lyase family enzyme
VGIVQCMKIESLDHVALWTSERDRLADFFTAHVGMHVIERTDKFTIVGSEARRGKLTLFVVPDRREAPPLGRIYLRVPDLETAADKLPEDAAAERADGLVRFTAPEGLPLGFVEADGVEYDLHHVVLNATDPERSFAELAGLGFTARDGKLWVGDSYLEVTEGPAGDPERSLLNHVALRVDSAADHIDEARERELEIADIVDAPNTYALFVWGPERVKLEYVEHKESFSLV